MNKTTVIIGVLVLAVFLFFGCGFISTNSEFNSDIRPNDNQKPTKLIENSKIILVKNVKLDYLKLAIEQFCNLYNKESYIATPRLYLLDSEFAITFPYDIEFEQYCYFINYLENAHELSLLPDYKPEVKAWYLTKNGDEWINGDLVDKNIMIYIPEWDEEHDNVYLTTEDGLGFKMGFALGEASQRLDAPVEKFAANPIDFGTIKDKKTIDFQ